MLNFAYRFKTIGQAASELSKAVVTSRLVQRYESPIISISSIKQFPFQIFNGDTGMLRVSCQKSFVLFSFSFPAEKALIDISRSQSVLIKKTWRLKFADYLVQ